MTQAKLEIFHSSSDTPIPLLLAQRIIIGVYALTCKVNNRMYIGSAGDCHQRAYWHLVKLRIGKHVNKRLQADYSEHGGAVFGLSVIEECKSIEAARQAERCHIRRLRTQMDLYNVVQNGKYRPLKTRSEYTSLLRGSTNVDISTSLQQWMAGNGKDVTDLIQALGVERMRAYRLVAGAMPHLQEMRAIYSWTSGEVDANAIYGLSVAPQAAAGKVAA